MPCTCCLTTLWNTDVSKQAINNKLQGSVAKYLKYGGAVNNQIKKGLLLSLPVKKNKIGEYLAKLLAKRWLSRALSSLSRRLLASHKVHETTAILLVTLRNIYRFRKKITDRWGGQGRDQGERWGIIPIPAMDPPLWKFTNLSTFWQSCERLHSPWFAATFPTLSYFSFYCLLLFIFGSQKRLIRGLYSLLLSAQFNNINEHTQATQSSVITLLYRPVWPALPDNPSVGRPLNNKSTSVVYIHAQTATAVQFDSYHIMWYPLSV